MVTASSVILCLGIVAHLLDLLHTGGVVDCCWIPIGMEYAFNVGDVAIVAGGVFIVAEHTAKSLRFPAKQKTTH